MALNIIMLLLETSACLFISGPKSGHVTYQIPLCHHSFHGLVCETMMVDIADNSNLGCRPASIKLQLLCLSFKANLAKCETEFLLCIINLTTYTPLHGFPLLHQSFVPTVG